MATSALVLILAVLLLGGVIAALGDFLGSKVGKARLRLFKLRPRQTATVVTVVTGTLIAASTLGILFTFSKPLRQGIFEIDEILKRRRQAIQALEEVTKEKDRVEEELLKVREDRAEAQARLQELNQDFNQAQQQLEIVSTQANSLKLSVETLLKEREELLTLRTQLREQMAALQKELDQFEQEFQEQDKVLQARQQEIVELEQELTSIQGEIETRDQTISQLDREIQQSNQQLLTQRLQLNNLNTEISYLQGEVAILEQYYQDYQELRERRIALVKGQVLAFNSVRIINPDAAQEAIDYLLREANRNAIRAVNPDQADQNIRLVQITQSQVKQLLEQIRDGRDYVIRILSASNYVQGEIEVRVFADVALNEEVFSSEQELARVSMDPNQMGDEQIQDRLDLLLANSQFRARRAGVLGDIQVEDGKVLATANFLQELNSSQSVDEIRAVVIESAYTAGPLKLRLVAISKGQILFTS